MRKAAWALALALTVAGCGDDDNGNGNPAGPSNTGPIVFTSQLSAANEVPPVTNEETNARGSVTITMNVPRDASGVPSGGGTVNFSVQLNSFPAGTPAVAAHIHPGAAGVNGGARVNTGLTAATAIVMGDGTGNLTFNNVNISQADAQEIYNAPQNWYFNVHTQRNPGGAVRGQLTRSQ